MSTVFEIPKGVDAIMPLGVLDADGNPATPSAAPTIERIMVNGAQTAVAGATVTQQKDAVPANITGWYNLRVPTTTLAYNAQVAVHLSATVDGKICRVVKSFIVSSDQAATPSLI